MTTPLADRLRLMVVTDRKQARGSLTEVVSAALRGGATCVQLREKDLGARELLALARSLREITSREGALLVVNDRIDVALASGADGVQLGWRSLPVPDARRLVGASLLIGASTHDLGEVEEAATGGADFVTFGPVFDTASKRGLSESVGIEGLESVARVGSMPVIGLGGIREGRVAKLAAAGASGFAVLSRVMSSHDPESTVRLLLEEWRGKHSCESPRASSVRGERRRGR